MYSNLIIVTLAIFQQNMLTFYTVLVLVCETKKEILKINLMELHFFFCV